MIRFIGFSLRRAFQGLWRNRVMTLAATVTMVLMLILLSSLLIVVSGMEAVDALKKGSESDNGAVTDPDTIISAKIDYK